MTKITGPDLYPWTRRSMLFGIALGAAACVPRGALETNATGPKDLDVDHIIVAIDSLNRGIEQLRQLTGVTAVHGAAHAGRGTHSAWMALGPRAYLEIQAPNPGDTTRSPQRENFTLVGLVKPAYWALHTSNADRLRADLMGRGLPGGDVVPGKRPRGADTLRWRSLIPWGSLNRAVLPYYMERIGAHPSSMSPDGCTLASIAVMTPKTDSIRALLSIINVTVRVDSSAREQLVIELDCPTGRVKLPMSAAGGFDLMRDKPPPTAAGVALGITGDSVAKILGTADFSIHVSNTIVLSYSRGRPQGLQVSLVDGRVDAVVLSTAEAGMLDGMKVGLPLIRLMVRWGRPTHVEDPGAVWRASRWEIVVSPDVGSHSVSVIQLRTRR